MAEIGPVDYYKCVNCGFTISKTHKELDRARWERLNYDFHKSYEAATQEFPITQPPYAEQALMLSILSKNNIIDAADILDYAGGHGTLRKILKKYFAIDLPIFDPYVTGESKGGYVEANQLKTYKTVFNSAMFEHILSRKDLDSVHKLVKPDGALIVHTVVCEAIPKDPNWFYLEPPVHTAFHTNRSMEILMGQWGYHSSIYSPKSKCWVLLKQEYDNLDELVQNINEELQSQWFFWKKGFMDYWK